MSPLPQLQPTLWRTCRTIANRTRLRIPGLLFAQPGQSVSLVATHLKQPLSLISEYLRMLESRGLLEARRVGRRVTYRPGPSTGDGPSPRLVAALRLAITREPRSIECAYRAATAFTHPRRIEIFRALLTQPQTLEQIQISTRIPVRSLLRHLSKLEARGFVASEMGIYTTTLPADAFGRTLALLTGEQ